jgi:hypothetical protein
VPEDHDSSNKESAYSLLQKRGLPIGVIYKDESRPSFDDRLQEIWSKARTRTVQQMIDSYEF